MGRKRRKEKSDYVYTLILIDLASAYINLLSIRTLLILQLFFISAQSLKSYSKREIKRTENF